ncbi:MAG: hypothetical protein JEZ09_11020 [Salinivirgaceae bacterium]|nr:hypothetical protein [Salinivirgaceae bacterium]
MTTFGLFNEPKNIIELFTFDLTTFFYEDDYEEISSDEKDGVFMIEYEKNLPWMEHNLFQKVIFRIFNDKKNIIGSNHINIDFPAESESINALNVSKLVNKITQIYGWDDENKGEWNAKDESDFKDQAFLRQWTLGEGKFIYSVRLLYNHKYGLILKILFFNHLLELIKK